MNKKSDENANINTNDLKRMEFLVEEVSKHGYNYYVLDSPTISDKEYDLIYDELVALEQETGVTLPNSPTQRVGGEILAGFKKYSHKFRLYSLDKCQTKQQLKSWVFDIKKHYPSADFTCEYKFDGLSLVCTYKNGYFVSAGTRGNGFVGEDVTKQARTIKTLPLKIDFKGELIVQGEAMIRLSNLEKYNKKTQEPLKNARNAVAGAIRNLDPKETAKRNLDWFVYTIHYAENKSFKTQAEMMGFLKSNGFDIGEYFKICKTAEEIFDEIDIIDGERKSSDILMDGVVIRLNDIAHRDEFGFTSKFPKWAIAYKFEAEEVSSILKDVIWQVGRTGKITPIGIISPVELAGATIKRATLNNIGDIKKKRVAIGSRVFIRRSNEVIPEILGLAELLPNSKDIVPPKNCPSCDTLLVENGANLFCPNFDDCKNQIIERLTNFTSKEAMNIEGLSISTITSLNEKFGVKHFSEIYELTENNFLLLENFKAKKARNIINAIEKSQKVPFHRFINALGIGGVGVKTSKDLAKKFANFDKLKNAEMNEILNIYNIGDVVASNIYEFFKNPYNLNQIDKLKENGVKITYGENSLRLNTIFDNKLVVLTGSLNDFSRLEATAILENFNAQVTTSVTKKTDLVIVGENAGSKLDKAKNLGIKIINEQEFKEIIEKFKNNS
ncbi:MAG: NAD-dependent DNA ligase LigA [Clostridia bacterium]|nr:NAD-dependent DNA ligase LigA [Clostridia bacterium]